MSNDFSVRPFVAGSLVGIRSFVIDPLGRLRGVSVPEIWRPGENVATCRSEHVNGGGIIPASLMASYRFTLPFSCGCPLCTSAAAVRKQLAKQQVEPTAEAEHVIAGLTCGCGYYAYFDNGANPYHKTGQVHGLIEGYGVATVGTRGFRCEKAKLLALIVKPKRENALTEAVRRNYPEAHVFPSKRAALEQFPLTQPDPITPDNTPDFWQRAL